MQERTDREQQLYELEIRAVRFLARREHSRAELVKKLCFPRSEHQVKPDAFVVEELLDSLIERNLQSDARFAESFARERINRGRGPVKLRAEMRERGVSDELMHEALSELKVDWFERAIAVREKRFGLGHVKEFKEKARQMRFLLSRGFTQEQISCAMSAVDDSFE